MPLLSISCRKWDRHRIISIHSSRQSNHVSIGTRGQCLLHISDTNIDLVVINWSSMFHTKQGTVTIHTAIHILCWFSRYPFFKFYFQPWFFHILSSSFPAPWSPGAGAQVRDGWQAVDREPQLHHGHCCYGALAVRTPGRDTRTPDPKDPKIGTPG